jgi:hypothetical protein
MLVARLVCPGSTDGLKLKRWTLRSCAIRSKNSSGKIFWLIKQKAGTCKKLLLKGKDEFEIHNSFNLKMQAQLTAVTNSISISTGSGFDWLTLDTSAVRSFSSVEG